jgi:hypothetical protein
MNLDCEWNIKTNKPLTAKEILNGESHAIASWILGGEEQLAVCEECVNNPILVKKYKIRKIMDL